MCLNDELYSFEVLKSFYLDEGEDDEDEDDEDVLDDVLVKVYTVNKKLEEINNFFII